METADHGLRLTGGHIPPLRQDGDHVDQRKTDLADMLRQVEKSAETAVPDRQAVRRVEDGNALLHLRKRCLHHVLVVLQRLRGLVEEPDRIG